MKMFSLASNTVRIAGLAATLALAACGGGGGDSTPTGTVQMSMTDAPACYSHVMVNVAKVRVSTTTDTSTSDSDSGWKDIIPPNAPVQVDLVNLTNGQLQDLGNATVPAGSYHQIRLVLASTGNTVTPVGGTAQPLKTPSGQQSGLKIKADFDVAQNQTSDLLMDFDACKSIVLTGSGTYLLKPVVRLTPKPAGSIQGFVNTSVTQGTATYTLGAVNVTAQQNGSVVRSTIPDANGKFVLAYLPSGTYTVVIAGAGGVSSGAVDATKGAATRVVDSVPVGTSTVSINTSTSTIVLSPSGMGTVSGTISTGSTTTATAVDDDATVSAQQTVNSRQVEVNATRPDDSQAYTLHLPLAAPEMQLFSASGLPAPSADTANAGKYTIGVSASGLATKSTSADISTANQVVNFAY